MKRSTKRATKPPKVTEAERAEMVRLYAELKNVDQVAARVGRATSTVSRHLHMQGITVKRRNILSPQEEEAAAKLYEAGFSTREVAAQFGMHYSSVNNLLKRHGVELREPYGTPQRGTTRVPHGRFVLARFLYEKQGLTPPEISKIMGVSPAQVRRYLKYDGVVMRSHSEAVRLSIQRRKKKGLDKQLAA